MLKKISPSLKCAVCAVLAALLLSIMMATAKKLTPSISTPLVVFMRSLFGLIFFLPFFIKDPKKKLTTKHPVLYGLRITFMAGSMMCTYYTYRHLPLAFATSLGMTGALFTTVMSILILKDKVDSIKWVCLAIGYLGVLCIIKPTPFVFEWAVVTALVANFLTACGIILVKILSRDDSSLTIMSYSNVGVVIFSGVCNYSGWELPCYKDLLLLAFIGLLGVSFNYLSISALKQSTPSFVAPFEYTRLLFSFLIGFIFFNELPDIYIIIGSLIIMGATYTITYREKL